MKITMLRKYNFPFALLFILTGVFLIMPACGGGGGDGGSAGVEAVLLSIDVSPGYLSMPRGTTQQFKATGVYSDSTKRDITASVTWSSSDMTVATINHSGLATSIQAGTTFIIATLSGITSNLALHTVTSATLTSITVNPTNSSIAQGATQQFVATGMFSDSTTLNLTTQVTWSSSNTGVATINNTGLATSFAAGSATITATSGSVSGTASLTITSAGSLSGSLDNTFGTGGMVVTGVGTATTGYIGTGNDAAYAMAIQGDGKIVAAGQAAVRLSSGGIAQYPDFAVVRYNVDGSLDNTFGGGGKVTTPVGTSSSANALAIQGDGKIVAVGSSWNGSKNNFGLVRYNVDGSLDSTFGTGGVVTTAVRSGSDYAYSVAIQADGKIVVAGSSWNGSYFDFALARYNADGSLDDTFGTGGIATTGVKGSSDANASDLKIQSDGKIVVAGGSGAPWSGINFSFAIVRFNTDGSLDNTFGTAGKIITDIGTGGSAVSMAIQGNGKIIAAGGATVNNNGVFALVRYNTDGSLDSTFGTGGIVTTGVGNGDADAYAMAIQIDGKIVAAGRSWNGSNYDFAIVRYNADGNLNSTFAGGKVTTAVGNGDDIAYAVVIQSDRKIVVTGRSWNGSNYDFAVVRYLP